MATEQEVPGVPVVLNPLKTRIKSNMQQKIYEDNVVLIHPTVDASDKELYQRNGYKTASKNMVDFIKNGDQGVFTKNVFRPKRFGELTKDITG